MGREGIVLLLILNTHWSSLTAWNCSQTFLLNGIRCYPTLTVHMYLHVYAIYCIYLHEFAVYLWCTCNVIFGKQIQCIFVLLNMHFYVYICVAFTLVCSAFQCGKMQHIYIYTNTVHSFFIFIFYICVYIVSTSAVNDLLNFKQYMYSKMYNCLHLNKHFQVSRNDIFNRNQY